MIEFGCTKGRHVPFIRCDNCGQGIRDAENAVVAWHATHRMRFIHKGACAQEFREHSSDEWGAMELDRFLIDLFNNARVRWRETPRTHETVEKMARQCFEPRAANEDALEL